jgi:eukaryotic-like serine/threonine-protein kinase
MSPADWTRVKTVALEAWARPESEREAYIASACSGDGDLRREVSSLVTAMSEADDQFEVPAAIPDRVLEMTSLAGYRLGAYDILSRIGAGGMGEVYKARDSRLHRTVAIKILPELRTGDQISRERMIREARAIAALNHPHICTIHDVGDHDGREFLVMEYVEGETLAARLARGPLPIGEAVRYALQIASALCEAHRAGIVHRDVKPANIVLARPASGAHSPGLHAKLLDFGVAKMQAADIEPGTVVRTEREPLDLTTAGLLVGTAPYLAPERIDGNAADVRTDIFAFGAVLFEMLTGRRAFDGSDRTSVLEAIRSDIVPRPSAVRPGIPPTIERVVVRSLAKNPGDRYRTMDDVVDDLRDVERRSNNPRVPRLIRAGAAALVLVIASAAMWTIYSHWNAGPRGEPAITRLAASAGVIGAPAISPDGSAIAFSWSGEGLSNPELVLLPIGSSTRTRLTNDPGVEEWPAWSPDGRDIAFIRCDTHGCAIHVLAMNGGGERKLRDLRNDRYFGLAWSPDGSSIVFGERESPSDPYALFLLRLSDAAERRLTAPAGSGDLRFAFSPDGGALAIVRVESDGIGVHVLSIGSGTERTLLRRQQEWFGGVAWSADGRHLILSANQRGVRRLWKLPVAGGDLAPLALTGEDSFFPSVSARSQRMVYVREFRDWDLSHMTLARGQPRLSSPFPSSARLDLDPAFSPDGRKLAFVSERSGTREVWVSNADGSAASQLTSMNGPIVGRPSWSPDGRSLAFHGGGINVMPATGGQWRQLSTDGEMPTWSADGRFIYFMRSVNSTFGIWKVPVAGGPPALAVTGESSVAREAPRGDALYYARAGTGIWRRAAGDGTETLVVPDFTWSLPAYWSVFDDGIYYAAREVLPDHGFVHHFRFFEFASRRSSELGTLSGTIEHWVGGLTVSPDRRTVIYAQRTYQSSEVVLVEGFR